MKTYGAVEVELPASVTMTAVNVSLPRMNPGTVGSRASLDDLEKRTILCHCWDSSPGSFSL